MAQSFEPAADGRIDAEGIGLQHEPADQARVDSARRLDRATARLLDLLHDFARLLVRQLVRGGELHVQAPLFRGHHSVEFLGDLLDLADAAFLGGQPKEIAEELVGVSEQLLQQLRLRARIELRVAQDGPQLGHVVDGGGEVAELGVNLLQALLLLRGVEQRARIGAMDDGYFTGSCSRAVKSRSLIASSISRRWSASSRTLPVTFAVATSVSSATSARICSRARCVSAWIRRCVSSRRRCRSASVSSLTRRRCASATLRASARICSAWPRAWPRSERCSWMSRRASSRALSASSRARLIRSRRSSISAWIRPKASRFST